MRCRHCVGCLPIGSQLGASASGAIPNLLAFFAKRSNRPTATSTVATPNVRLTSTQAVWFAQMADIPRVTTSQTDLRDVGGGEVDHQQTTVGLDGDMSLAPDDLLASVITSCFRFRSLDRLVVDDAAGRARLASDPLTAKHQRHVVDGLEQEAPNEPANHRQTVGQGGKSFGNVRQPPPERARYRIGHPLLGAPGRNGSICAHSSSVKFVG